MILKGEKMSKWVNQDWDKYDEKSDYKKMKRKKNDYKKSHRKPKKQSDYRKNAKKNGGY